MPPPPPPPGPPPPPPPRRPQTRPRPRPVPPAGGRPPPPFSIEVGQGAAGEEETPYTSARNAFPGIVTAVKLGDVAAQVEIQAGPHRLVSLLTREAVEELGLEVGMQATARVKSTSVHIDRT
ncbi:TOBE domain-containing protein [Streptomyces rhizosphaericola]|uniref:TOBE domain-containing protein n=1 Tax=Streptomyces rhizosphaericola TaxID=2564098 RepID=UPI003BF4A641